VGLFQDLRNLSVEEAVEYARRTWEESEQMPRLEMLAELWYAEASYKEHPLKDMLLEKALGLFQYVDRHSTEYSLVRLGKIEQIKTML
jgi:hypothetical protein